MTSCGHCYNWSAYVSHLFDGERRYCRGGHGCTARPRSTLRRDGILEGEARLSKRGLIALGDRCCSSRINVTGSEVAMRVKSKYLTPLDFRGSNIEVARIVGVWSLTVRSREMSRAGIFSAP
ncbi:hypothetical protein L798_01257 [Zootermopsis nevadensis]|uniref:Uncharacterized protein n=1 Tax=Zootermopsis nevadensis TaxID=136037 RepID=A0A067QU17_ZOONE|nr:hypothetical protein L798_01257 [Zootermopsis nevadensis]